MSSDFISDAESLFRSVRKEYLKTDNGIIRPTSEAFGDKSQQISVDRADLCENAPKYSQKSETDAVLRILTADVREISHITDQENTQYALNVIADPLEYNLAHALIVASPEYRSKTIFKKCQNTLVHLFLENKITWAIPPSEPSDS